MTTEVTENNGSALWNFMDNLIAQALLATGITVFWLIWIFIEILGGGN